MTDCFSEQNSQPPCMDRTAAKRVRRHVIGRVRDYYVVAVPGFESLCRRECLGLGFDDQTMRLEPGGLTFCGRLVDCVRANLHLRTATRVLMRVDSFMATNLRRLAKNADRVAWELFFSTPERLDVKVKSHRSRLYHTDAVAQVLKASIARRLTQAGRSMPTPLSQTLYARVVDDRVVLSVDSSGAPLYKRGFKAGLAHAPIRETLAAAILLSAGYDGVMPLVDPMCGSGTFSLEAAMMAKQMAPGCGRSFAFMGWPAYNENQWAFFKHEAESRIERLDQPRIFAADIDPGVCERLAQAVDQNALNDAVTVAQRNFFNSRADLFSQTPGLVAINPPYGVRLGSQRQAKDLFMAICRHLNHYYRGWRVALVTPHRKLVRHLPFAARQLPFTHGGLKLLLATGTIKG